MCSIVKHVMKKLKGNRGLDYHKVILDHAGIWPSLNGKQTSCLSIKYILPRVVILDMNIFMLICLPMEAFSNYGDVASCLQSLYFSFVVSMLLMKGGYFLFQHERVNQLTIMLERIIRRNEQATKYESESLKKSQRWINMTLLTIIFLHIPITMFALGLLPYLLYSRQFYTRVWLPFDAYASPTFEITLLFQSLVVYSINWCIFVDAFIISLLIQTVGQFEILQHNIRNIRSLAVETVRERKAESLVVKSTSMLLYADAARLKYKYRTFICTDRLYRRTGDCIKPIDLKSTGVEVNIRELKERTTGGKNVSEYAGNSRQTNLNVHFGRANEAVNNRVSDSDREETIRLDEEIAMEMERRLGECNKHHQHICSFVEEFGSTFSYILSHQLICNIIPTVMIILWVKEVPAMTIVGVGTIMLLMVCAAELFLYCWLANKVTSESSNVREAVYGIDWFDSSESFKRSMRIIMSKANQPIVITIAGYVPLSMETFQGVIQLAYSYYTALSDTIDM